MPSHGPAMPAARQPKPWSTLPPAGHFRNCILSALGKVLVALSCPTLCDPTGGTGQAPLSMGILQARILEWVGIPFSRGSSRPRDRTRVSCTAGRLSTIGATRETL